MFSLRAHKEKTGVTKFPSLDKEGNDAVIRPRLEWFEALTWRRVAAFAPPRPRFRLGRPSSSEKGNFEPLIYLRSLKTVFWGGPLVFLCLSGFFSGQLCAQEDYLTDSEIAKLRDEFQEPSPRLELFRKFLNLRFDRATTFKTDLMPASTSVSPKEEKEDNKEKGKHSKKKKNTEPPEEENLAEERPNSFLGWIQQYTQCLEDFETNLGDLSSQRIELKPLLKVLGALDADLTRQTNWVEQVIPKLKGVEKKTLLETAEVLQDLSPLTKSLIQKYAALQEQQKKSKK